MIKIPMAFILVLAVACTHSAGMNGGGADRPTGTLVATNMNDNTATVLDAATGRVLGTLPTGEGPHEVTASHDGRWAVVSNYGVRGKPGHTLTVIDLQRVAVTRTIDLQNNLRPHGIAFMAGDSVLAVTSEAGQNVLLVRFADGEVISRLPTKGRGSHMFAVPPNGTHAFTANIPDGTISEVDLRGSPNPRVIPVAKFIEGIAITPDGKSVWVGSNGDSIVVIVDAASGQVVDTLRGFGMPYRLAVSLNGQSTVITDPIRAEVRIYDAPTRRERFRVVIPRDSVLATAEVAGSPSPEGVAISSNSRWAFVTLQGRNRAATIDLSTGRIVALAPTGVWSDGIAYSPLVKH